MSNIMLEEIHEQPEVLDRLFDEGWTRILGVGRALRAHGFRFVMLFARGTSDNAAYYGKYLIENLLGLPTALGSPSSFTLYGANLDLRDVLVVGISQSGESKDILESLRLTQRMGAVIVSVTNSESSSLAAIADYHLPLLAGSERSVAATKTYTAELLVLYLLVRAMGGKELLNEEERKLPDQIRQALGVEWIGTERYRYAEYMTVVSRGYNLATAKEAALKLMETNYLFASAFSAADLRHGPIAMIGDNFPVLAFVPPGKARLGMLELVNKLTSDNEAELLIVGDEEAMNPIASARFTVPESTSEALSPVLYAVPAQLLAEHLARTKGRNPDAPRGLNKVTETW